MYLDNWSLCQSLVPCGDHHPLPPFNASYLKYECSAMLLTAVSVHAKILCAFAAVSVARGVSRRVKDACGDKIIRDAEARRLGDVETGVLRERSEVGVTVGVQAALARSYGQDCVADLQNTTHDVWRRCSAPRR